MSQIPASEAEVQRAMSRRAFLQLLLRQCCSNVMGQLFDLAEVLLGRRSLPGGCHFLLVLRSEFE